MKITCGTDIIEIDRIRKSIDQDSKNFINKIYTENEIEYCESKSSAKYQHYAARFSDIKYQSYAGRFAAKEAIFKAISNNLSNRFELSWKDAEVINDKNGRPRIEFINKKIEHLRSIEISISHCREYATANVVAVWDD